MEAAAVKDDGAGDLAALRSPAEREPDKIVAHWEGPKGGFIVKNAVSARSD